MIERKVDKPESCDRCPHSTVTNKGWLLCTITGELLDYYLDYQGKLSPNCPYLKDEPDER